MASTTRARILEEAERHLLDRGYAAFTIAGVRDALGLSSGSMFHAFPSKPALVAEVYVRGMRDYQQTAVTAIGAHPEPADAIGGWIAAHLRWVGRHRALAAFLFATPADEVVEAAAAGLAEANATFETRVEALVAAAEAAGLVADLPVPLVHSLIMGSTQEYCRRWCRGVAEERPEDLIDVHCAAALAGLRATTGPTP